MTIELLQFRFSPYNEKVRWALDFKRVPHRRTSLLPGPHLRRVRALTGRTLTPVLVADGQAIDESARIVEWLDARWPEPALCFADPARRTACDAIVRRFDDDIAPRGRRAVLGTLLRTPGYMARVFGDGRPRWVQRAYALVLPLAAGAVRQANGIAGQASIDDGVAAFREGLDFVVRESAATGFLVGERFSVADLTAASVLAVCVDPPDSPMTRPRPVAAPFAELLARYERHPGADWVRRIYREQRRSQRDFDGASPY